MRHLPRSLHLAYGALLAWFAYCALQCAANGAAWAAATFAVAAVVAAVATWREGLLEDALHREAVHTQRQAWLARPQLDTTECAAAVALAAACCETWWTTCGTGHDPACPRPHQSTT
ncbi:hypothetical protein AB0I84_06030 [Streptomyces spectabilis]|uniref:hypothetical protein n=1 Tax=Streptomyces spectabilis TaxID=68270 RepID=UPI0033E2E223